MEILNQLTDKDISDLLVIIPVHRYENEQDLYYIIQALRCRYDDEKIMHLIECVMDDEMNIVTRELISQMCSEPKDPNITIRSLGYLAKSSGLYEVWHHSWYLAGLYHAMSDVSYGNIALWIARKHWLDFINITGRIDRWYHYMFDNWRLTDNDILIRKSISKCVSAIREIKSMKSIDKEDYQALEQILLYLRDVDDKTEIEREMRKLFTMNERTPSSDIQLANGAIINKNGQVIFRERNPEDYVIRYINYNFPQFFTSKCDKVRACNHWLRSILDNRRQIGKVYRFLSSTIFQCRKNKCMIMYGNMADNFEVFIRMISQVFSAYVYKAPLKRLLSQKESMDDIPDNIRLLVVPVMMKRTVRSLNFLRSKYGQDYNLLILVRENSNPGMVKELPEYCLEHNICHVDINDNQPPGQVMGKCDDYVQALMWLMQNN